MVNPMIDPKHLPQGDAKDEAKEVVFDIPSLFKRHTNIAIDLKRRDLRPMVAATIYAGWIAKLGYHADIDSIMDNSISEADRLLEKLYPYPVMPVDDPTDT